MSFTMDRGLELTIETQLQVYTFLKLKFATASLFPYKILMSTSGAAYSSSCLLGLGVVSPVPIYLLNPSDDVDERSYSPS